MRVGRDRTPLKYIKLQIVEYEGQKYKQSKAWNLHNITFEAVKALLTNLLGQRM